MADDADLPNPLTPEAPLRLLSEAETVLSTQEAVLDAEALTRLKTIASRHPDIGGQGVGEVVAELLMLTEQMITAGRQDRDPVAVFVQAWRLLQTTTPDREAKVVLLGGLKALRSNVAQAA